jgi:hypothetical protein
VEHFWQIGSIISLHRLTDSLLLPASSQVTSMPAVPLFQHQRESFYKLADLIRMRRAALRIARSLPMGSVRNQQRQIAASLGRLVRNDDWLDAHVRHARSSRSVWSWQAIKTAPYDLPLELAVVDDEGPHALIFPCIRIEGGWSDERKGTRVFLRPTHWREWRHLA